MTRLKMIFAAVAAVATMSALAVPAMANDWNNPDCWWWDGDEWVFVCDNDGFFLDDFGWGFSGLNVELGDVESGDITQDTTITSSGENSNQAAAVLNASNTGNVQNVQGFLQYGSEADDIEISGGSIDVSPSLDFSADQTVEQSAVAVW